MNHCQLSKNRRFLDNERTTQKQRLARLTILSNKPRSNVAARLHGEAVRFLSAGQDSISETARSVVNMRDGNRKPSHPD
jgi:hypothetical protein